MISILVADDHILIREGLRRILAAEIDMEVCGEAASSADVLDRLRELTPDLLLLDFSMPGTSGFELIKRVKIQWPKVPILVLTMHDEELYAVRVMRAGASGYITKGGESAELVTAIRKVASGRPYISSVVAEQLAMKAMTGQAISLHEELSNREMQVLELLVAGKSVKEAAAILSVSVKTISTHKARLLDRLQLHSIADLVRYSIEHRLVVDRKD